MQYNSEANSQDCVSEILDICGATTATYTVNAITRRFNTALDEYFDMAIDASGAWPFDDQNQTSAAIVTQNLVSGTNAYKVGNFAGSVIGIRGITILDDNAAVQNLTKENFHEVKFEQVYTTTTTGQPTHYTLYGDFIYLRPTPNYNETNGLRAYTDRNPLYMAVTDTTKEPGVPKKHHMYLCRKAALPYLVEKRLAQTKNIAALMAQDEQDIKAYYARRDRTVAPRFIPLNDSNQ